VAYDQTPINDVDRDARLPDASRFWVAAGVNYKISHNCDVDLGYAHVFFANASIHQNSTIPLTAQTLVAHYHAGADLIGGQFNYHFG
jgi:long-chain fatty acid transport protein